MKFTATPPVSRCPADQASKTAPGRRGIVLGALVALGTVVTVTCGGGGGDAIIRRGGRDSGNGLPTPVVTADCEARKTQIEGQTTGVTVSCNPDNTMTLTSDNGLPNHDMMHGIVNWIDRVPVPYPIVWTVPLEPEFQDAITNTTGIGPNAFAINGVPIFHYSTAPDPSIDLNRTYRDTVKGQELDDCGGHSGQGDDYHYHQAPTCLVDAQHLDHPIAYTIDGAPVFYGGAPASPERTARSLDGYNAPSGLDVCNAMRHGDTWIYYTTETIPYVVGCHHTAGIDNARYNVPLFRDQKVADALGNRVGEVNPGIGPLRAVTRDGDVYEQVFEQAGTTRRIRYKVSDDGSIQVIDMRWLEGQDVIDSRTFQRPLQRSR